MLFPSVLHTEVSHCFHTIDGESVRSQVLIISHPPDVVRGCASMRFKDSKMYSLCSAFYSFTSFHKSIFCPEQTENIEIFYKKTETLTFLAKPGEADRTKEPTTSSLLFTSACDFCADALHFQAVQAMSTIVRVHHLHGM